jgi:hypothetical protein
MATSNSVDFNLTRDEIINDALVQIGAIEAGETPSAADTAFAARQLNRMVKTWQVDGVRLWTRREAILFLSTSQGSYILGPNTTDHAAELRDAVRTELSADAASGASTITVDSVTGMAAADKIGVVLSDGTIDWDTISSISTLTITLAGTLSGAASTDGQVFAYTTNINRPLRIINAQRLNKNDVDTPIDVISHAEYQRLPSKTDTGLTNNLYYQPETPDGFVYLWPEPNTSSDRIRMTCLFPIEDFDTSAHNADLPQEWLDCLVWNLSKKLLASYGAPATTAALVAAEADSLYVKMTEWDREPESTTFAPDFTGA